jgi:hypothetical protein
MSNHNEMDNFSKEQIEQFVASCLGITTRAVRVMKKDNYDRFQREAMGALCQQRGLTIKSMLSSYNVNPNVLCLDENLQKLEAVSNFANILRSNKSKADSLLVEELKLDEQYLLNFFTNIFSSYGGDNYAYLNFHYDCKFIYNDSNEVEDVKALPYLNVELKDIFCGLDSRKICRIPLIDEAINKKRTLLSVYTEIENSFPEVTKKPEKYYTNKMTFEIKFTNNSKDKIPEIMQNIIKVKEGDFFLEYLDVTYQDTTIRYKDNTQKVEEIFTFFKNKEIEISLKEDYSIKELFEYWKKIGDTICSDDTLYLEFIKKAQPEIDLEGKEISDDHKQSLITTLGSIIIDSIAKGLDGSMYNAINKYIEPYIGHYGPVNKKHFEENWKKKENDVFTLEVTGRGKLYSLKSVENTEQKGY